MSDGLPSGKSLERLVAVLERALAGANARIVSPCRDLIDRDTGRSREHDVIIFWSHGHHKLITAIECRDKSRKVGVPEVESFADKCASTGVSNGVIVSSRGFCKSARTKALMRSIVCMDLTEAGGFDWLATDSIIHYERQFENFNVQVMFADESPSQLVEIFDTDGQSLTNQQIFETIAKGIPEAGNPEDEVGRVFPVRVRVNTVDWNVKDRHGNLWLIDHLLVDTSFTTIRTDIPIKLHQYQGGGKSYSLADANLNVGATQGRIVFVRNEDQTTSILWVRDSPDQAAKRC